MYPAKEDACDAKRPLYSFFQLSIQTDFPGIMRILFARFDMQIAHGTSLSWKLFPKRLSWYSEPYIYARSLCVDFSARLKSGLWGRHTYSAAEP